MMSPRRMWRRGPFSEPPPKKIEDVTDVDPSPLHVSLISADGALAAVLQDYPQMANEVEALKALLAGVREVT